MSNLQKKVHFYFVLFELLSVILLSINVIKNRSLMQIISALTVILIE